MWDWDWLAKHAPIATATIAFAALIVAWLSVTAQKRIARRRAAIDFFIKTELDEKVLDWYWRSRRGFDALRAGIPLEAFCSIKSVEFGKENDYMLVRRYLSIHELIAIGIHNKVLDEDVCYHYWGDLFLSDYAAAEMLITYMKEHSDAPSSYEDIKRLNKAWRRRRDEASGRSSTRKTLPVVADQSP